MRVLFLNPVFPPSLWDFSLSRDIEGKRYTHPPLALPTLAALTPAAHTVRLLDENVEPVDVATLAGQFDLVGLTGYYIQRHRVFELADQFRSRGVRVAIGGPIVEASTIDTVAAHADHVFLGEAEYTWPQFIAELEAGHAQPRYEKTAFVDMRDSPPPRYELLALGAYSTATIETSRGCPMSCEFCEIPIRLGQRARSKDTAQIMAEVRAHHALGADSIFFVDDHFVGNRSHAKRLLEELVRFQHEIGFAMAFSCQFTINLARDTEMVELLHAANFRRVFVGIETPRRESLASVRKKQNLVGDLLENIHLLQSYGIVVWAGMIVGFDTDDAAIFDEQRAFIAEAGIPVVMSGLLQAIPGTPLHTRMAQAGRLRETEASMSGVRGTYDALLASNITPVGMDDETLVCGYQQMIHDLYEYELFADRLLASLRRARRPFPQASRTTVTRDKVGVLARLARYYLAPGDRRRRRLFLRVVGETLRHRPDQLETVLMHLVVYKHFRLFYHRVAALPVPSTSQAAGHPFVPAAG